LKIFAALITAFFIASSFAAETTLDVPDEVGIRGSIDIIWSGPDTSGASIRIYNPDDSVVRSSGVGYPNSAKGHSVSMLAPEEPGEYSVKFQANGETLASHAITVVMVEASMDTPESVPAGARFDINWTGPNNRGDYVGVAESGASKLRKGAAYVYTGNSTDGTLALTAPEEPGTYDIIYRTGAKVLARTPLHVTGVSANLKGPDEGSAGSVVTVLWEGPDNSGDYITLAERNGERIPKTHYVYTSNAKNNAVSITLPEQAGEFDIVYVTRSGKILGRMPIAITDTNAKITNEAQAGAGSDLMVNWSGPDNSGDYIALAARDGDLIKGSSYAYTGNSTDNAVSLIMPEQTGDYDVVYATKSKRVLARSPVTVTEVTATLDAPAQVQSKLLFEVQWEGPGNPGDWIGVVDPEQDKPLAYRYLDPLENHVELVAPQTPGDFQLVYRTRGKRELATKAITILPAPEEPGFLQVTRDLYKGFGDGAAVEIILDASGSMLQKQGSKRRIEIARETLTQLIRDTIPAETGFALRVFGHRESGSCRTDLDIPLGPLDPPAAIAVIENIQAMNLAKTPIGKSLALVEQDLGKVSGERIVILVTDGEETCDGDPALAIKQLRNKGWDIKINIVGYAIDDDVLQETFKSWAALGQGQYLSAANADELAAAIRQAVETSFQVIDGDGTTVAGGMTNGAALELPPGNYTVEYSLGGKNAEALAEIQSGKTAIVDLP
jgi:von Willebrand factor type A domain-containing protein